MKKNITLFLIFIFMFFPIIINAKYNGGDGGVTPSGSNCPDYSSKLCHYNNMNHMTVKISLIYFNENGTRDMIGHSVVYTNNNWRNIADFFEFNIPGNSQSGYNATGLKNYFYDNKDNFITLLNRAANLGLNNANYKTKLGTFFQNYCSSKGKNITNCNQEANSSIEAKYGFRVIIEPYFSGLQRNNLYFMTLKEIANEGGFTDGSTGMYNYSMILHTTFNDVNIRAYGNGTSSNTLAGSINSGYGYNIIDFAVKPTDTKCDKKKSGVLNCCKAAGIWGDKRENNTLQNLTELLTDEEIEEYCTTPEDCKYSIDSEIPKVCSGNNSGYIKDNASWKCTFYSSNNKKVEIKNNYYDYSNDYCAVYCKEEIDYSLPNGANVVSTGRYLTIEEQSVHGALAVLSPVKFNGKKICRTTDKKGGMNGTIDKDKFLKDFEDVESRIKISYDKYINYKNSGYSSTEIANAKLEYEKLVKKRESILNQIKACSERKVTYDFSPTITFSYEEPIYGGSWKLKKDTKIVKNEAYYYGGNSRLGTSTSVTNNVKNQKINKYICNEEKGCYKGAEDYYPLTDWFEKDLIKDINYKLPDNVYRYISKKDGRSYNTKEEAGDNYIEVEQSNLPIHYSTTPGDYGFKFKIDSLGENNKFEKYFYQKKIFNGKIVYDDKMEYACSYKVSCKDQIMNDDCEKSQIVCKKENEKYTCNKDQEEGINIIYRPISLIPNTIFLNKDGDSRTPGKNWNNEEIIKNYITYNRNVLNYDIYKLDPMYEITLTPKIMKQIRNYNKEKNGKITTVYEETDKNQIGILGYADNDSLKCNNGVHCISEIIRKWGVTGCAVKGNSGSNSYNKCTNTTKW